MFQLISFILFCCFSINLLSQTSKNYIGFIPPVNIPLYLSGSFAELRTDHFHSGIDIKTQGISGIPIYAVKDGYISRIKVQATGYGKSIYINHPDGYTSVYGHLSNYYDTFSGYVKKYQYKNRTQTLDIYPAVNELAVVQGALIGWSGNTGSSSGPHLHFEIRKTTNQNILNVQKFDYPISDNVPPRINNFYIYSFDGEGKRRVISSRKKIGLNLNRDTYRPKTGDTIIASKNVAFGMEVYDFMNGTSNRYGIYYTKMYVDSELVYHFQADEFSFAETRFINAHMDYALRTRTGEKVQLLFRMPNNRLSMYKTLREDGIIRMDSNTTREITIEFGDYSGNQRQVKFFLTNGTEANPRSVKDLNSNPVFNWDVPNKYENHLIKISIPSGSFYEDTQFTYSKVESKSSMHPWRHNIHTKETGLHLPARISILADGVPLKLLSKSCIIRYGDNNTMVYEGGRVESERWLTTETRNFGQFGIEIDTIAPQIIPVNFKRNENLNHLKELRFIIRDNLSNIQSYKGFIDGTWALFEYDPKDDLLVYVIDPDRIGNNKNHEIELYIEDGAGNQASYRSTFFW